MSALNLTVRFACEIAALVALVWWGWPALGFVAALAVGVFWGTFIGPKAKRRLSDPARFAVELAIFAVATVGYWAVGQHGVAAVFATAALVTAVLVRIWPEPTGPFTS